MISDRRAERDAAYSEAHIRVYHPQRGTLVIEPRPDAGVVGEFPNPDGWTIYIVTAHNPGRQLSDAENAARHQELARLLASRTDLTVWDAEGGDPAWQHREESLAVVGLTDEGARELGRTFEQEAVFAWRPRELVVLDCHSDEVITSGWSVTPE